MEREQKEATLLVELRQLTPDQFDAFCAAVHYLVFSSLLIPPETPCSVINLFSPLI